ncbi:MAK11 [Mytilus edulis]|uniref:MAK11 n=1 Tax=Mytilus edulis TaxID=6550 RepID=A0A8S3V5L0_MYTED|nr:MAK11 [Mytilus edulis]
MEVVVGTYEEVLLGYRLVKLGEKWQFELSFTDNSHTGCIKTIAVSTKGILASGGTDENIKLFNLKKRSDLGSLVHHSGSVLGVEFYKGNHMFTVSEDGSVAIWKHYTWECLKTLRGHKSGVNSISVHPSGKLALTVSKDKTLKTWNLITGKCAYTTNLKSVADLVLWSTDGTYYAVVFQTKIDIYKVETATIHCTMTTERRPNDVAFLSDTILVYGCEGGTVNFHDINNNQQLHQIDTETNRIRGITLFTDDELCQCLITASSDGYLKLYQVQQNEDSISTTLLTEHDSKFRLTCISVYLPTASTDKTGNKAITEEVMEDVDSKDDNSDQETLKTETPKKTKKNDKRKKLQKKKSEMEFVTVDKSKEAKIKAKKRKRMMKKQNTKKLKI